MTPANPREIARWSREFRELGVERVRSGLIASRWESDKRRAARLWLERNDTANWQAARPRSSSRGTFFLNARNAKWWGYATIGAFLLFGAVKLLRWL